MKYTRDEIEFFKLRARLRRLQRDLETEMVQGHLFPRMSEDTKNLLRHEINRLQNRLIRMMEIIN